MRSTHFELSVAEYAARRRGHVHRRRQQLLADLIGEACPRGGVVVELGCGPGDVIAGLAPARPDVVFCGVDVEPDMIEHAQRAHRAPNLTFAVADATDWSPDTMANLVFAIDVVHHVHDVDALIRTVDRLLAPSGRWIVIEPNIFHPFVLVSQERMRRAGLDEDHFRPWRFEPRVRAAGLRVDERRTAFAIPGRIARVPRTIERIERVVERVPVLGGSVVYCISRPEDAQLRR